MSLRYPLQLMDSIFEKGYVLEESVVFVVIFLLLVFVNCLHSSSVKEVLMRCPRLKLSPFLFSVTHNYYMCEPVYSNSLSDHLRLTITSLITNWTSP